MSNAAAANTDFSASTSIQISLCHDADKMPIEGDNRRKEGVQLLQARILPDQWNNIRNDFSTLPIYFLQAANPPIENVIFSMYRILVILHVLMYFFPPRNTFHSPIPHLEKGRSLLFLPICFRKRLLEHRMVLQKLSMQSSF